MKINKYIVLLLSMVVLISCGKPKEKLKQTETKKVDIKFQNKGHELIYKMVKKVGNYQMLLNKKDVIYTYTYSTPDGKTDVSTEKYIFKGELSYGKYTKHERTFPELEGVIEQGYDGKEFWLKNENQILEDEKLLKTVAFKRPTNFYWFAMLQKLLDPNLNYDYLGEKIINEKSYDIVKVSFNSSKPTDIYQVYINKETSLVDQFLFTVADFGLIDTPLLMQVAYENVDGILIPATRKYKMSDWNAFIDDKPWTKVNWTDIKFDNGLSKENFSK